LTVLPIAAGEDVVRVLPMLILQILSPMLSKIALMSVGEPGKYPPGDAIADSRSVSLSPSS
jgi:hypothetical protein